MASRWTPLFCLLALVPGIALAQSPDPAAERARLANQRIQVEAERRAKEETERQRQTATETERNTARAVPTPAPAAEPLPAPAAAAPGTAAIPARSPERDAEISRALEQLHDLGELRDAGYVTEAEFQRIKDRILDRRF